MTKPGFRQKNLKENWPLSFLKLLEIFLNKWLNLVENSYIDSFQRSTTFSLVTRSGNGYFSILLHQYALKMIFLDKL